MALSEVHIATPLYPGHTLSTGQEASDRKMADLMMDGACLGTFDAIFVTVRHVFRHFGDGRSDGRTGLKIATSRCSSQ